MGVNSGQVGILGSQVGGEGEREERILDQNFLNRIGGFLGVLGIGRKFCEHCFFDKQI